MMEGIVLITAIVIPAIVLHELAHGFTALWLGDTTAKDQGRLTLNPLRHLDVVGSLIVPGLFFLAHALGWTSSMILFGWAKPVPVNFGRLRFHRWGLVMVALAGPLVNIALALLFVLCFRGHDLTGIAAMVFVWGVFFNVVLAVFNMIPIPPLDGSRVLAGILPLSLAREYVKLEPFGFIVVVVLLQLGLMSWLYPVIYGITKSLGVVW